MACFDETDVFACDFVGRISPGHDKDDLEEAKYFTQAEWRDHLRDNLFEKQLVPWRKMKLLTGQWHLAADKNKKARYRKHTKQISPKVNFR